MSNHTEHPPASFLIPRSNGFYAIERDNQGTVHVPLHALLPTGWQRQQLTPIRVHSPSGLEYGYGGSGPADLASPSCRTFAKNPGPASLRDMTAGPGACTKTSRGRPSPFSPAMSVGMFSRSGKSPGSSTP